MELPFVKFHGNGNDFILIDEMKEELIGEKDKADFAIRACHRRFGVGGDGVLFVQPSEKAAAKMRIFNSDGSEAEMCGNGIRCFARYLVEEGVAGKGTVDIETLAGVLTVEVKQEGNEYWVTVDMGVPKFRREEIPAVGSGELINEVVEGVKICAVNTGVPHAIVFSDNLEKDIIPLAKKIRYHSLFPQGTNVNFVRVLNDHTLEVRTYERGVENETLSCGTGSVASVAIASKLGYTGENVEVRTLGGVLRIYLKDGHAYMEGPAAKVFEGILNYKELRAIDI